MTKITPSFWHNRRVFLTGHTGFKGGWLTLMLTSLGAKVKGYSLQPPTTPNLFELANVKDLLSEHVIDDILHAENLEREVKNFQPEVVFHLAAQPLVRESYKTPRETFLTNSIGTLNVLEALRDCPSVRSVVVITTDKCYHNEEWVWSYRENDALGGKDPYSASKACTEIVTLAYRQSFFQERKNELGIATARAGNVLGGGDYAVDRLIPDCLRATLAGKEVVLRNPQAVRPWLFVLEPLYGYIQLAEKLALDPLNYSSAWNFSPQGERIFTVEEIVKNVVGTKYRVERSAHDVPEATYLQLDSSKALRLLNWQQRWPFAISLQKTVEWYHMAHEQNLIPGCMRNQSLNLVETYAKFKEQSRGTEKPDSGADRTILSSSAPR